MAPRVVSQDGLTAFVPNGSGGYSRRDLAILLIGAARENGIDDSLAVRSARDGFFISDELVEVLYDEQEAETEPEVEAEVEAPTTTKKKRSAKKASGNRAAKNSTTEKE